MRNAIGRALRWFLAEAPAPRRSPLISLGIDATGHGMCVTGHGEDLHAVTSAIARLLAHPAGAAVDTQVSEQAERLSEQLAVLRAEVTLLRREVCETPAGRVGSVA